MKLTNEEIADRLRYWAEELDIYDPNSAKILYTHLVSLAETLTESVETTYGLAPSEQPPNTSHH